MRKAQEGKAQSPLTALEWASKLLAQPPKTITSPSSLAQAVCHNLETPVCGKPREGVKRGCKQIGTASLKQRQQSLLHHPASTEKPTPSTQSKSHKRFQCLVRVPRWF